MPSIAGTGDVIYGNYQGHLHPNILVANLSGIYLKMICKNLSPQLSIYDMLDDCVVRNYLLHLYTIKYYTRKMSSRNKTHCIFVNCY